MLYYELYYSGPILSLTYVFKHDCLSTKYRCDMLVCCIILSISIVQCSHFLSGNIFEAFKVPVKANYETLQYVQVVWRHGDRTPSSILPSDKKGAEKWVEGLGELTLKGIAQQYRLGQWLRRRYGAWLGDHLDRNEVYIAKAYINSSMLYFSKFLKFNFQYFCYSGLFPPAQDELWDSKLSWQPVPVHSLPRELDKQLYEEIHCPTAELELEKVWQSERVRAIEKDNADILRPLLKEIYDRFLNKKAGLLGSKPKFFAYSAVNDVFRYELVDCADPCTLEKLFSNLQKYDLLIMYFPVHWEAECGLGKSDVGYMFAIAVLAFTTVIFGGILALDLFLKYNRKPRSQANEPLIEEDP
uniref:Lysosomal acid phosphatase n=1 Tax=Heterorhabditis bacteriophora TaxID=37862 RepID=A0A1I7WUM9_HETBA